LVPTLSRKQKDLLVVKNTYQREGGRSTEASFTTITLTSRGHTEPPTHHYANARLLQSPAAGERQCVALLAACCRLHDTADAGNVLHCLHHNGAQRRSRTVCTHSWRAQYPPLQKLWKRGDRVDLARLVLACASVALAALLPAAAHTPLAPLHLRSRRPSTPSTRRMHSTRRTMCSPYASLSSVSCGRASALLHICSSAALVFSLRCRA